MIKEMIVDADFCIKLGSSEKYRFLYDVLPLVAEKIYMHTHAHGEVMMPSSAVRQLGELVSESKVELVNEKKWSGTYNNKNKSCSRHRFLPWGMTSSRSLAGIWCMVDGTKEVGTRSP